jgi:Zn-dependent protease/CBS domain-containing protein
MMADTPESKASTSQQSSGTWSLGLGSVSGIPIRLHFTFLLLLAYLAIGSIQSGQWGGLFYIVGIFACVVLHELGHSLVAQRYGIGVADIVLYPIGGVARLQKLPKPAQELWIAIAGPMVNVVIAGVLSAWLVATKSWAPLHVAWTSDGHFLEKLVIANAFLFGFNLVPAFPMDGGRVLRAILALSMGELRATEIAAAIGQLLAIAFGFYTLTFGNANAFYIFIAIFVFLGAGQEANMYRGKALVEGLPVSAAMITDFRTLAAGATLREAADLLIATSQQDFPVEFGAEVIGVLPRSALLKGLAAEGVDGYVNRWMVREFPHTTADGSLEDAAAEMRANGNSCILVMDGGQLKGMLTMENLAEVLVLQEISKRRKG